VRGADTTRAASPRKPGGLYAVASGFRETTRDDFREHGAPVPVYDALYAYCKSGLGVGRDARLVLLAKTARTFCYGFLGVLLPVYLTQLGLDATKLGVARHPDPARQAPP